MQVFEDMFNEAVREYDEKTKAEVGLTFSGLGVGVGAWYLPGKMTNSLVLGLVKMMCSGDSESLQDSLEYALRSQEESPVKVEVKQPEKKKVCFYFRNSYFSSESRLGSRSIAVR